METKVIKHENSITTVTVKIEKEKWSEKQKKALERLAKKVQIKGFRKGGAPIDLVKKHVSQYDILNEAAQISLNDGLNEAIKQNNISYYDVKNVSISKISDAELELVYNIITNPTCTLGQYKGLDVALPKVSVTKDEIQEEINKLLDNEAELVLKDGEAAKGDTVVLDFKGYIDGKEFEGGSADNYELVLGSGQFIPGFEDQLIGHKSEEKVDVEVTFPEQYIKDLAGKNAKFVCKIHEIKEKKRPELNDEFVSSLGIENVKTLAELEKYEEEYLNKAKTNRNKETTFREILNKIIANSTYEIADEFINEDAKAIKNDLLKQIESNGLTYEQYKEMVGLTDDKLEANYFEEARRRIVEYLTIITIGREEKIALTDEDLEKYYSQIAEQYKMEVGKVKEIFAKNENKIKQSLIQNKIEQLILDNNIKTVAKKTTKKTKKEESTESVDEKKIAEKAKEEKAE